MAHTTSRTSPLLIILAPDEKTHIIAHTVCAEKIFAARSRDRTEDAGRILRG